MRLEYFIVPENKVVLKKGFSNHNNKSVPKGYKIQLKELPMVEDGTICVKEQMK